MSNLQFMFKNYLHFMSLLESRKNVQ